LKNKNNTNREQIISEWLELFPIREYDYEMDENDLAIVEVPHPENWFTRKFLPKPKAPAQRIHLDKVGTFVWKRCDGNYTVQDICAELSNEFGDEMDPVDERTVMFLQQMYKQEFIKVYAKRSEEENSPE
jgi:hypothetical protein